MSNEFVERRESGFYVAGSRVPIDRIVSEYRSGEDPVTIQSHYPTLRLEQVEGAIAFYNAHTAEVEASMAERRAAEEAYVRENPMPLEVRERLAQIREAAAQRRD